MLRVENICVIVCDVFNSNLMNVSRSKMQLRLIFLKIWKGLNMTNATKTSIRINKFLALSMYHHFCLFLQAIQQNHFISFKVIEKETAIKDMKDLYGHFIHTSEWFFKGNYLKLTRSRSLNNKKFQILPTCVLSLCIIYYLSQN